LYKIVLKGITNKYEYEELIKMFLRSDQYQLFCDTDEITEEKNDVHTIILNSDGIDKNLLKQLLFVNLNELTGMKPEWGILTGVRPVKLAYELIGKHGFEKARELFLQYYLLSEEKADLIIEICTYQQRILNKSSKQAVGIYIGIPFCPTRCLYCSFTSNQVSECEISRYLTAMHEEIEFVAAEMKENSMYPESVYIGGGTPTTLDAMQLDDLLTHVRNVFDLSKVREFTVEAGRPDTITAQKLAVMEMHEIDRISINPQSMKEATLKRIGRDHSPEEIRKAFALAKNTQIPIINADLIAGLPEETPEDFERSLKEIIAFGVENITIHTLAVKRASRLAGIAPDFHYKQADIVREMLKVARNLLFKGGYRPYYLYRQKHMAGNFENVGYCKGDTAGIYNIRIMEEMQTIVALGAGGISKVYYPAENRLERIPNVSNYEIYIERLEQMLQRKREQLFIR